MSEFRDVFHGRGLDVILIDFSTLPDEDAEGFRDWISAQVSPHSGGWRNGAFALWLEEEIEGRLGMSCANTVLLFENLIDVVDRIPSHFLDNFRSLTDEFAHVHASGREYRSGYSPYFKNSTVMER
ncbi:MAG: hypothetical protein F6K62_23470 [Sphaerospermopsis sp. SIO1G2]|nr:hypothetical protein [Sphaerospermopsis sp. SIO1G2]